MINYPVKSGHHCQIRASVFNDNTQSTISLSADLDLSNRNFAEHHFYDYTVK